MLSEKLDVERNHLFIKGHKLLAFSSSGFLLLRTGKKVTLNKVDIKSDPSPNLANSLKKAH